MGQIAAADGRFFGLKREKLSGEYIRTYLATFHTNNRSVLLLQFGNEKDTTLLQMPKVLSVIKDLADPKMETTVLFPFPAYKSRMDSPTKANPPASSKGP